MLDKRLTKAMHIDPDDHISVEKRSLAAFLLHAHEYYELEVIESGSGKCPGRSDALLRGHCAGDILSPAGRQAKAAWSAHGLPHGGLRRPTLSGHPGRGQVEWLGHLRQVVGGAHRLRRPPTGRSGSSTGSARCCSSRAFCSVWWPPSAGARRNGCSGACPPCSPPAPPCPGRCASPCRG
mgnify:CR=1 FL=1